MTPPPGARLRLDSEDITWEQFEQFFLALLNALPEVDSANRYGAAGDDQEGIDHEIVFADGSTGGAQCRQRNKFGKPQFEKAVADNEYAADRTSWRRQRWPPNLRGWPWARLGAGRFGMSTTLG